MRLKKWFQYFTDKEKTTITTDLTTIILSRKRSMCNVLEYGEHKVLEILCVPCILYISNFFISLIIIKKVIYKRYASLYFVAGIDWDENELYTLEVIHRYVQILDEFFGNVCELDIIYNFDKAYYALDELFMGKFVF